MKQSKMLRFGILLGLLIGLGACSQKTAIDALNGAVEGSGVFASRDGEDFTSVNRPDDSDWGAYAEVSGIDQSAMNEFMSSTSRSQTDERIYLKLDPVSYNGETVYEGELRFAYDYEENGDTVYKETYFKAKQYTSTELNSVPKDNPEDAVRFNKFYDHNGNEKFVALFEEANRYDSDGIYRYGYGALMIILEVDDDGYASGSLYFKNYEVSQSYYSQKPKTRCWDIEIGNFECRDFLVNDVMRPDLKSTPSEFEKIGVFSELDFREALDN